MEYQTLLVFSAAALALVVTPGPDMLLVLSRSVCQGTAAGIMSVLGFCVGTYCHALAAGLGLSSFLLAVPWAYNALRFAGAMYLLWLAWQAFRSKGASLALQKLEPASLGKVFQQALFTNILNPKVILFFIALFPQFVVPAKGAVLPQVVVLATILNAIGATFNSGVAVAAGRAGQWLSSHPRFARFQQQLLAGVFSLLALRLIVD